MYSIIKPADQTFILRDNGDGTVSHIPMDESNSDYQQYLVDTDGGLPTPNDLEK
jgi:hypothetical protein